MKPNNLYLVQADYNDIVEVIVAESREEALKLWKTKDYAKEYADPSIRLVEEDTKLPKGFVRFAD